jgi:hypothetical protein
MTQLYKKYSNIELKYKTLFIKDNKCLLLLVEAIHRYLTPECVNERQFFRFELILELLVILSTVSKQIKFLINEKLN